jgi:hypothetical protein
MMNMKQIIESKRHKLDVPVLLQDILPNRIFPPQRAVVLKSEMPAPMGESGHSTFRFSRSRICWVSQRNIFYIQILPMFYIG